MDLAFFRRGHPRAAEHSARLDYGLLTAALEAFQTASVTAQADARSRGDAGGSASAPQHALVEILLGGPRWREAVDEQGGSFNAAWARPGRRDD